MCRPRVLLLRRRRPLDDERRRPRRVRRRANSSSSDLAARRVERGFAIRVPKAYPIYDADYAERVSTIRAWLDDDREPAAGRPQRPAPLQQLRPLDADGHACRRQPARGADHDVWAVNAESVYHEEAVQPSIRTAMRPRRRSSSFVEMILAGFPSPRRTKLAPVARLAAVLGAVVLLLAGTASGALITRRATTAT